MVNRNVGNIWNLIFRCCHNKTILHLIKSKMSGIFISFQQELYQNKYRNIFQSDPLLLFILFDAFFRSRKKKRLSNIWLSQRQFVFSSKECKRYWLKETQHGKLERRLLKLCNLKLIKKTGTRSISRNCNIYQFVSNDLIKLWKPK